MIAAEATRLVDLKPMHRSKVARAKVLGDELRDADRSHQQSPDEGEEIGNVAAFVASDKAGPMTAATVNVSAGALID